ncbi:MAG: nuclear transport factor 2 family protein [Wenzhouxiangellaceae bacterium]|nr:nuclear transport factor 2 family protein [Wenzhouxiangellaceae bacterium]
MRVLACLLLLILIPIAANAERDSAETEIHALLDAFLAGASRNEIVAHERFWADELVYTSSAGERRGKDEILRALRNAATPDPDDLPRYRGENVEISVHGAFAVLTFRLVAALPDGSEQQYFNTGVFARKTDGWRAIAWQATRIPADPES